MSPAIARAPNAEPRPPAAKASERGATLVEALIATLIVISTITGVAQLLLWARRVISASGMSTMATVLATEKLEQLRALQFEFDDEGAAFTDDTTDLTGQEPSRGGAGLQTSPLNALDENTPGCVDYLDAHGNWRGTGVDAPAGAAFVRRWAIVPFASDPLNTQALHVVVLPLADAVRVEGSHSARAAQVTTIRTRGVP